MQYFEDADWGWTKYCIDKVVGLDCNLDEKETITWKSIHRILFRRQIVIAESLDLRYAIARMYEISCCPLKLNCIDATLARMMVVLGE